MKYKIGDRVRVKEDLMVGKYYNNCYFNSSMDTQRGKIVTIEEVDEPFYYIKEDEYVWTEEMFSGLAEESRNLIPLIAKELGVEIGEEFKISNQHNVYKLTEDGLIGIGDNGTYGACSVFFELINGKEKIIKLPQKPKLTEAEKVILENLPKEFKHIERTKWGLSVYGEYFNIDNPLYEALDIFGHLFKFIKMEDKEPYKIQELLEEYKNLRSE